ncbi:MAG: lytic transglycosylase, partial [Halomonas sp.]
MLLTLGSTMISGILLAAAAQASNGVTNSQTITEGSSTAAPSGATGRHFWDGLQLENRDAWSELRSQLAWHEQPLSARAQERVDTWIDYYQSSP